jgi:hypothetical protein
MLLVIFLLYVSTTVVPNKSTIQSLIERFLETMSIGEKRRSGHLSVLSNDSLEYIRARLLQSPRKSLKRLSQQTRMTHGSVQDVSNCIHTEFKSVMNLKKLIKRKGCVNANGSDNLYEMV